MNTWRRKILALASVPLLAVPSAIGVYTYLEPQSGWLGAGLAAAGFEVLYIGVNILIINTPELRTYARNVSLGAVIVAVLMNSLAHYGAAVPGAYSGAAFAVLPAILAVVASAPLAGLAYAVSVLLHRLSEAETPQIATAAPQTETAGPPQPPQATKDEGRRTEDAPQTDRTIVAVAPDKLVAYLPILAAFDRDPNACTADLIAATAASKRTIESRRAELVKLGALHRTPDGYVRNGVELTAKE